MTWSGTNAVHAGPVAKLLDDVLAHRNDDPRFKPGMPREQAEAVIHAVIWMASAREDSFSNAYAHDAFYAALGHDTIKWLAGRMEFDMKLTNPEGL